VAGTVVDFNEVRLVTFRWNSPASSLVTGYELILEPADANQAPLSYRLSEPQLTLKTLPGGKYHWSVRTLGPKGQRGPASAPQIVEVKSHVKIRGPMPLKPILKD
jgi:hypothetical protein